MYSSKNQKNKQVKIQFEPLPPDLTAWAIDKDRRYPQIEGRTSYSQALLMCVKDFESVKFGRTTQKSLSYWVKVFGWDWRKVVRFVAKIFESMRTLWAKFDIKRFIEYAKKVKDKAKSYVDKARGKEMQETKEPSLQELEGLWLESLKSNAKGPGYIVHIKNQLQNRDPQTVENFQAWLESYKAAKEGKERAEKIQSFDYMELIGKSVNNQTVESIVNIGANTVEVKLTDGKVIELQKEHIYKAYEAKVA